MVRVVLAQQQSMQQSLTQITAGLESTKAAGRSPLMARSGTPDSIREDADESGESSPRRMIL